MTDRAKQLRRTLERLFEGQPDDSRLRDHLEGLVHDESFPELTWYWGPILYQRNRAMFRSFISNRFSTWQTGRVFRWSPIAWSAHADRLESWLASARQNRDVAIVQRLLQWKFAGKTWGVDTARWSAALLEAFASAKGPAARAAVLEEFEAWFELDEETALRLYQQDRAAASYILRHLPSGFWTEHKRTPWTTLSAAAERAGDQKFARELYRKQVSAKQWSADVLALADRIADSDRLCDELKDRHPEGYGLDLTGAMVKLLEKRGRDVMPYVRDKLPTLFRWYGRVSEPFVKVAQQRGWWDLWAAAIRADYNQEPFNNAVKGLLDDAKLSETDRLSRLQALAGVSREWNWPGFGLAIVHGLKDDIATRLYQRYPALVRGAFKPHITPRWWAGLPQLLRAARDAGDDDLVDLMASRYVTRPNYDYGPRSNKRDPMIVTADELADYYDALCAADPPAFARRAANVLTQIPAYSIHGYQQLLRSNKLARLLFVRSFDDFLAAPAAVRDLVEASDIHVQMLAYRILARDDERARTLAVETLDILIGTLLRPLHRKTRLAAFHALANAARADLPAARLVLGRAREALRLPDIKYPKEELVGLIGAVLHHQPTLRGPREQPLVYASSGGRP